MTERLLLVDYENVQALNVATIPPDVRVHVVLGAKQKTVVAKVEAKLKPLGERAIVNRIKTLAPNAVDFCIAYYLGEELAQRPHTHCVILSKDKKGFDPLLAHLTTERGRQVRRVDSQKEAFPALATLVKKTVRSATAAQPDNFERLVTLLNKDKKENKLPRRRKTLESRIKPWFPKLGVVEHQKLVQRLFNEGLVVEAGTAVIFKL